MTTLYLTGLARTRSWHPKQKTPLPCLAWLPLLLSLEADSGVLGAPCLNLVGQYKFLTCLAY